MYSAIARFTMIEMDPTEKTLKHCDIHVNGCGKDTCTCSMNYCYIETSCSTINSAIVINVATPYICLHTSLYYMFILKLFHI